MTRPPELSVLVPLHDARGDSAQHLRTWTHQQTHRRDRFQVVITSDGEDPVGDRDVAALLKPHDRFEVCAGANMIELWNRAAELASSEWLLFTENHVQAEPDCVEKALEGIRDNPGLDAASIEHGHIAPAVVGELGARWFDDVYGEWFAPEQWRRLNLAGFVIRRDVHRAVGGHEPGYGLFAAPLLSARLNERGAELGHLPEARILHIQCHEISEHHDHSADYVIGESEARTTLPPTFAERYFGFRPLLWNRRATEPRSARRSVLLLLRELMRSLARSRADVRCLIRTLGALIPEAIAGIRPRRRLTELGFRWSERIADSRWVPRGRRYRAYLSAQDRVTRLAQLRWIEGHHDAEPARLGVGVYPIESVGEGTIVGVHGLELNGGRHFRWSGPVVTIHLDTPRADEVRIDTGGLRGSPLDCVIAVYLGSRRLSERERREDGTDLVISLPGGAAELTLLCRVVTEPSEERRALGLPIFAVELGDARAAPERVAAPPAAALA